jgi:GT2 family glycosyltransferase
MAVIDSVIVAVKDWSEELEKDLQNMYGANVQIDQITNNDAIGICAKYNQAIDALVEFRTAVEKDALRLVGKDYHWTIFTHDDAILKSNNLNELLNEMYRVGADIVGVAGNANIPAVNPGGWWDGLTTAKFRGSGAVIHRTPDTENMFHIESYGPYPQPVAVLDGVWFAVRTECLKDKKLRFDETLPGYHYYDVDFCATARSLGYKIWVAGIMILHDKWGKGIEDPAFKEHQKIFVDKWSKQKHLYYKGQPSAASNPFVKGTTAFNTNSNT